MIAPSQTKEGKHAYYLVHRAHFKLLNSNYRLEHKVELNERSRIYYSEHKERAKELMRESYLRRRTQILATAKEYRLEHRSELLTKQRSRSRRLRIERKIQVLRHYSPNVCCIKCGFSDIRALSIDHVNGGGTKHRKILGLQAGYIFYKWLIDSGFPDGYQVLCMNCQFITIRRPTEEIGLEASVPANKVKRVIFET